MTTLVTEFCNGSFGQGALGSRQGGRLHLGLPHHMGLQVHFLVIYDAWYYYCSTAINPHHMDLQVLNPIHIQTQHSLMFNSRYSVSLYYISCLCCFKIPHIDSSFWSDKRILHQGCLWIQKENEEFQQGDTTL